MISEHTLRRRVAFSETDMAGIVHFSEYFKYMEAVEHDLFRRLGLSVVMCIDGVDFGWPRVHAECTFRRPLRFEDEFDVTLQIRELRTKAIVYDFNFTHGESNEQVARGSYTTVCTITDANGKLHAAPIPDAIRTQLMPFNPNTRHEV